MRRASYLGGLSKNRITFQHCKEVAHNQSLSNVTCLTLPSNKGRNPNTVTLKKYFQNDLTNAKIQVNYEVV